MRNGATFLADSDFTGNKETVSLFPVSCLWLVSKFPHTLQRLDWILGSFSATSAGEQRNPDLSYGCVYVGVHSLGARGLLQKGMKSFTLRALSSLSSLGHSKKLAGNPKRIWLRCSMGDTLWLTTSIKYMSVHPFFRVFQPRFKTATVSCAFFPLGCFSLLVSTAAHSPP